MNNPFVSFGPDTMPSDEPAAPYVCHLCGGKGYKTGGLSQVLCFNLAMYNDCHPVGTKGAEPRKVRPATGRNEPCPCGSGKKYKKCHGQ